MGTLDCTNAAEGDIAYYNIIALRLGEKDICNYDSLLNLCENYYRKTNEKNKLAEVYFNKALHYFRDKDIYDSAAETLNDAEQMAYDEDDYYQLTRIYWLKNAIHSIQNKCPETKVEFLKLLCKCKILDGDIKTAFDLQEQIIAEKDSALKHAANDRKLRSSFHLETTAKASEAELYWKYATFFCIIMSIFLLFVVFKRRRKRNLQLDEALAQNNKLNTTLRTTLLKNSSLQELTGSMEKEISRLKTEYDKQSQCITTLKQQLDVEIQKNSAYKKNGETLYNQIISNEPIVSWTKDDSVNFVEYYRTLRPDFVASLDNDYKKLSPRSKIILILEDIGKNIQEITKIMSFEESSYYSAKSRINGQKHS